MWRSARNPVFIIDSIAVSTIPPIAAAIRTLINVISPRSERVL
jgi:hypothetical protein